MLPILFESASFTLYSYPLFMGLAWGIGFYLTRFLLEQNQCETRSLASLFVGLFAFSWLGAKIFFLLFSSDIKVFQYLLIDSFWLGGGFVFFGGLLLALAFYLTYSLWFKKFPFNQSKYLAPGLIIGHGIGRIGCFLAGCCFGSSCELPWAVRMHGEFVHPVQLYESLGLFVLGYFSIGWITKQRDGFYVLTHYLLFYSLLRFSVEFFRGDVVRGVYLGLFSTSQLISIGLILAVLIAMKLRRVNGGSFSADH